MPECNYIILPDVNNANNASQSSTINSILSVPFISGIGNNQNIHGNINIVRNQIE